MGEYKSKAGGFAWKVFPCLNHPNFRVKQERSGWCPTEKQAQAMIEDNYITTFCDVCGDFTPSVGICRKCANELNKSSEMMGIKINGDY